MNMNSHHDHVRTIPIGSHVRTIPIGSHVRTIPIGSPTHNDSRLPEILASAPEPVNPFIHPPGGTPQYKQNTVDSVIDLMSNVGEEAERLALGVGEHVGMAPSISETMNGKLNLVAKVLLSGGVENVFRQNFSVGEREKLLKACQCYLSTTAGPIAGLLFISTEKISFCSERPLSFFSPSGGLVRSLYKVLIPLRQITRTEPSGDVSRATQKYIQISTADNFEFWFLGFVDYQKAFKYVQKALSQSRVPQ